MKKSDMDKILERAWRLLRAASAIDPAKAEIHLNGVKSGQFKRVVRKAIEEALKVGQDVK